MMNKGYIRRIGSETVDVQLSGSAAPLISVRVSGQIDLSTLQVGGAVLVDEVNGQHVVLHTLANDIRSSIAASSAVAVAVNNNLAADGSVPLTGNLYVTPGVTIDGYDISVLGQAISNVQAADTIARTGWTAFTHSTHLVSTIDADTTEIFVRDAIFELSEQAAVSNTAGEVEFMRIDSAATPTVDSEGAVCYQYTVTRRILTSPGGLSTGWAVSTLINGMTKRGYITVDNRHQNSINSPNITGAIWTDDPPTVQERIFRLGALRGILEIEEDDFGVAIGSLDQRTGYFLYNASQNKLNLKNVDFTIFGNSEETVLERIYGKINPIENEPPEGEEELQELEQIVRIYGIATDDRAVGDFDFGRTRGVHNSFYGDMATWGVYRDVDPVIEITDSYSFLKGLFTIGNPVGARITLGEEDGRSLIALRNKYGAVKTLLSTDENGDAFAHIGNAPPEANSVSFDDTTGILNVDGRIVVRSASVAGRLEFQSTGEFMVVDPDDPGRFGVVTPRGQYAYTTDGTGTTHLIRVDAWGPLTLENVLGSGEWRTWVAGSQMFGDPRYRNFRIERGASARAGFFNGDEPLIYLSNEGVGTIVAGAGSIAGWTIASGHLYSGSGANRAGMQPGTYPFYAGSETPSAAPFRVSDEGEVWLENAHISGILQIGGTVGGWTIAANYLANDTGENGGSAGMAPFDYPFYAGATYANRGEAPFRVTPSGLLYAFGAEITGTINAQAGNFTGSVYIGEENPRIHINGNSKYIESTDFASGSDGFRINGSTGNAEFNNITARGAITSAVFSYNQIQATAGEIIVAKGAGKLASNLTLGTGTRTIYVEDPPGISHAAAGSLWAVDDIVRVKDPAIGDVWLKITGTTDNTTNWIVLAAYQSGTSFGRIPPGTAIVNYGSSGQGLVRISTVDDYAPFVSIATHAGSPWTALTEKARLGNLSGISEASGYGLWTDNGYFTGTVNAGNGAVTLDDGGITTRSSTVNGGTSVNSFKFRTAAGYETTYWRVYEYAGMLTNYFYHGWSTNCATNIQTVTSTGTATTSIGATRFSNQPRVRIQASETTNNVTIASNELVIDGNSELNQDANVTIYGATSVDGVTTLGDGGTANYSQFDADGHLTFAGAAKPWNDMLIEPSARTTGANAPVFEKWYDDSAGTSRGTFLYSFDDANAGSEKEVFFTMQMSHAWDGGDIQFHVHWVGAVADTTATPRWGLEYTWKEPGGVFGDTTVIYATGNHLSETNITANKHYITAFTAISPGSTADDLSSVLIGRLFRDSANAADTYNATGAKVGLLYIDAHYQMARIGSNDEYEA